MPKSCKNHNVLEFLEKRKRLSYKEHRVNALVPSAEEGRDKLRKALGRSKYPLIQGCPNEETQTGKRACLSIYE